MPKYKISTRLRGTNRVTGYIDADNVEEATTKVSNYVISNAQADGWEIDDFDVLNCEELEEDN